MLNRSRTEVAAGRWRAQAPLAGAFSVQPAAAPVLHSVRGFRVAASLSATSPSYKTVNARLEYIGQHLLIYVDSLAPSSGATTLDLQVIGPLFDQTLFTLDTNTFGQPSDLDGNNAVIMLMTPVVNSLTPAATCRTDGYVAGFFDGVDLGALSDPNSNSGEVFYTIVPDPAAVASCTHTLDDFLATVPATFLHELQHLINFSQHVLVHNSDEEEGWLDEGLSRIAEELGSVHYEQLFPPPTGRTDTRQLFPDSAEGYITGLLTTSYSYLLDPGAETLTLHSDADGGLEWRGGVWLLLRWLGDRFGPGIFKQLVQTGATGTTNIAAATGTTFPSVFGDFSLALYTDSIPGIARSSIPAQYRFQTRNLRTMFAALYRVAGPSSDFPLQFPITVTSLNASNALSDAMPAGAMAFYALTTSSGQATVRIRFASPGGGLLPAALHPQVSLFRLPD